jgi:hypothetical protein
MTACVECESRADEAYLLGRRINDLELSTCCSTVGLVEQVERLRVESLRCRKSGHRSRDRQQVEART